MAPSALRQCKADHSGYQADRVKTQNDTGTNSEYANNG